MRRRSRFGRVGWVILIGIAVYLFARPHYDAWQLERSCTQGGNGHWNKDRRECTFGGPGTSPAPPAPTGAP